ncbi:serine peptidase [Saccharothrix obliqua]|uniref:serine peptidase n=1 Tax=Saccharothrix obliqua TaxID=2861747 RepID=UPI001C5D4DD0|nr:serine peptidase [Saccharothrix obliqua]MBW4720909.1 serine peptidase [Saccharothrix obliqua]
MPPLLGVHGVGNYKHFRQAGTVDGAAAALAGRWSAALGRDFAVAYYAHHLHRGTPQGPGDDPAALPDEAQDLLVAWVEALRDGVAVSQGTRTVRARQAADWLTRRYGAAARAFAVVFCREVHTYLAKPGSPRRVAARRAVADAVATHRPKVVVAHSLGSVVAYEALWAHPEHDVDLLVTVGSPLGMPGVVAPRLLPADAARPPRVARWVNVADVGDPVAVPRTGLRDLFTGVERDVAVVMGEWRAHGVSSYLRTPEVAALLE